MLRYDDLPPEFSDLSGLVNYVIKRTSNEWSSSCPNCGGHTHKNGEPPDRFRMWIRSIHGMPRGWCRQCGYAWTPTKGKKPTKEEVDYWRRQQIEVEQERRIAAERALEILNNERVWEKFYAHNNSYSQSLFAERGISDFWVEYLRLGLVPDYVVKTRTNNEWEYYHSPAISIPIWKSGGVVQNVKLRVTNPKCGADRYRNWYETGQSFLYVPLYDLPLSGTGVLVEGEFKAISLEQKLNDTRLRVFGVQSKTPSQELIQELKDLDLIYVWLDPDAFEKDLGKKDKKETAVDRMVRLLGKDRCRVVQSPVKVDDGINRYGLEPKGYLKNARKP